MTIIARRFGQRAWRLFAGYILLALVALSTMANPALAHHAQLDEAIPAPNAQLDSPPTEVRVWFSENVDMPGSGLRVTNASGERVDTEKPRRSPDDHRLVIVELNRIGPGVYTVNWGVTVEGDDAFNEGSFTFTVNGKSSETSSNVSGPQAPISILPRTTDAILLLAIVIAGALTLLLTGILLRRR
jgi:copper resistance protein C